MEGLIYLDYNATTPVDPRVLETMLPFFTADFGNAASRTHAMGWRAAQAVDTAREQVAACIGAEPKEIVFTSGATEAINLAIKGVAEMYRSKGQHIITAVTEHKAVSDTCSALEKNGATVTVLPVTREGLIDLQQLEAAITPQTILVCVMLANNETGVIQPMEEIAAVVHRKGALLFCDATQAIGKMNVDVQELGADLLCLSAHKFYGPKGIGALYVRSKNPRVVIAAQQHGGGHENGRRSGTLNVPGIVGLGKAAELAAAEWWDNAGKLSRLRTWLEQHLLDIGNVFINGSTRHRIPNTTSICFEGIKADKLIAKLPALCMATGSACSSALAEPSHVLTAMGLSPAQAYASVRFSLGVHNTEAEMKQVLQLLSETVPALRNGT